MKVQCPACDGMRGSYVATLGGEEGEREPCMYCDGAGEVDYNAMIEANKKMGETR